MSVSNPKLDAIVKRPVQHLAHWAHKYPSLWREHDRRIAAIKKTSPWPSWCYAPHFVTAGCDSLQPVMKYLSDGYDSDFVAGLSALAAWRVTKGIYLYDPTIYEELWRTPLDGDLPVELLTRLPEWCVYLPLQEPFTMGGLPAAVSSGIVKICYGVFAHLDYTPGVETRLILTMDVYSSELEETQRKLRAAGKPDWEDKYGPIALATIVLHLTGSLHKCLEAERRRVLNELETKFRGDPEVAQYKAALLEWSMEQQTKLIRPIVSLLLYLCSSEPDVRQLDPLRGLRNQRVKTKHGIRNFGPAEPFLYEVAYRIGAAFRLAQEAATRGQPGEGTHASPRPHIRKAHWHAFWTGPRAAAGQEQPTERKLILKWVAPIAVCVGTDDPIIPTLHPVVGGAETELEERR